MTPVAFSTDAPGSRRAMRTLLSVLAVAGILSVLAAPNGQAETPATASGAVPGATPAKWPQPMTTRHSVTIGGVAIPFSATAGYISLKNATTREAIADVAYIAFMKDGADAGKRPVTFAFNGGPGYASAWLNLGALGPWRIAMDGDGVFPSARPALSDNQESWLPFTDLVFIDPAGTGYGRILAKGATDTLWSVNGDINALATTIRRWSEENGRTASPKFLLGESYGGFRVPKIAHALQTDQGVGVSGLALVSPVLDFARRRNTNVLTHTAILPSMAATAMGRDKPVTRKDLAGVEAYARSEFIVDLLKGRKDAQAIERLATRVSGLTGLDKALVKRHAGRISASLFAREFWRDQGRVASLYDGLVTGLDPDRFSSDNEAEDQMRLGLHAPIVQAMVGLYRDKLKWVFPEGRYMFQNKQAGRQWKWGNRPPESVSDLASAIGLDPNMRVLIVHGLTDLVTPYFDTQLVLDQMAPVGRRERIRFEVYSGGHMFYSLEASRKRFRDDGRQLVEGARAERD